MNGSVLLPSELRHIRMLLHHEAENRYDEETETWTSPSDILCKINIQLSKVEHDNALKQ
jgi:hypothetical protein